MKLSKATIRRAKKGDMDAMADVVGWMSLYILFYSGIMAPSGKAALRIAETARENMCARIGEYKLKDDLREWVKEIVIDAGNEYLLNLDRERKDLPVRKELLHRQENIRLTGMLVDAYLQSLPEERREAEYRLIVNDWLNSGYLRENGKKEREVTSRDMPYFLH